MNKTEIVNNIINKLKRPTHKKRLTIKVNDTWFEITTRCINSYRNGKKSLICEYIITKNNKYPPIYQSIPFKSTDNEKVEKYWNDTLTELTKRLLKCSLEDLNKTTINNYNFSELTERLQKLL